MKAEQALVLFFAMLFVSACTNLESSGHLQAGRTAFQIGNYPAAKSHFDSAAQVDPNFVNYTDLPGGSVWGYVGRADYALGRYPQARQSLERAISVIKDDNVAKVYLGLTLVRMGDHETGVNETANGMKGLYDWLNYVNRDHGYNWGMFWDPRGEIRSMIQTNLAMVGGKNFDVSVFLAGGEEIGKRMDEEIDRAWKDAQINDEARDAGP